SFHKPRGFMFSRLSWQAHECGDTNCSIGYSDNIDISGHVCGDDPLNADWELTIHEVETGYDLPGVDKTTTIDWNPHGKPLGIPFVKQQNPGYPFGNPVANFLLVQNPSLGVSFTPPTSSVDESSPSGFSVSPASPVVALQDDP